MKNTNQHLGDLGQHWTPENIVSLMLTLRRNHGSVLEPSAGSGRFMRAIPEAIGIEIDQSVIPSDLSARYITSSFFSYSTSNQFNTCIGNPPYVNGKLLHSNWLGSWEPTIPVTANAYLHFIDKCIQHLSDHGELIFIVPSSFFSDTSKGSRLRRKMCETGAFTDVIFASELVKWDTATVSTIIFRWEKGTKQGVVKTNEGDRHLIESNGFCWLIDFQHVGFIGDFFKATVGAAPSREACENGSTASSAAEYIQFGKPVLVDETNVKSWPRPRLTPEQDKIFFIGGPTRKDPRFFFGRSPRHMDYALLPKASIDCKKAADVINTWFSDKGTLLGLIIGGRWNAGVKQLENCPIDAELKENLSELKSPSPINSW